MASYSDPTVVAISQTTRIQPGAFIALVAGVASLLLAGFFYWQGITTQTRADAVIKDLAAQQVQINSYRSTVDDLNSYDKIAKQLHAVFDKQVVYEGVFGALEKRFYKHMIVTSMVLNDQGLFTISGNVQDYLNYAKMYASFTDADASKYFTAFKPISVSKVVASSDPKLATGSGINFTFTMNLTPTLLATGRSTTK